LVTNTIAQRPSDIKQFSAMHSFYLIGRQRRGWRKVGKKGKKKKKKNPVKIPFNQKAQYQIIFPEAMTAKKDEKLES